MKGMTTVPSLAFAKAEEEEEEESARSALRWCLVEKELVDDAILCVAHEKSMFTADDVWLELGPDFPVTKGLTSRLLVASRKGLIVNSGQTRISERGGPHDHAQRLTVWYSQVHWKNHASSGN